ncbi:MAG: hypothetical protein J0I09_09545 [Sphingobacteriia bacterium]|nr:hypothetical protein [Sphingobacteriia bacterium]
MKKFSDYTDTVLVLIIASCALAFVQYRSSVKSLPCYGTKTCERNCCCQKNEEEGFSIFHGPLNKF